MRAWPFGHVLTGMFLGTAMISTTARAYSSPGLYAAEPARTGGGGGRAFTGAPLDGLDCAVCHRGGAAPMHGLRGGPGGPYTPGATYQFELEWAGDEVLGLTAEAADEYGARLGELRLAPRSQLAAGERCAGGGPGAELLALGERAVIGAGACGATRLRFQWTAPAQAVAGALYVALVLADGDGTAEGDGTRSLVVPLDTGVAASGCAVGAGAPWWLVLLSLRRRSLGLMVVLLLGGCARVQPHQRGRLAQPDMQLAPDPDLTAGPEHALEYREGSAGGLGGGGGGCGCN